MCQEMSQIMPSGRPAIARTVQYVRAGMPDDLAAAGAGTTGAFSSAARTFTDSSRSAGLFLQVFEFIANLGCLLVIFFLHRFIKRSLELFALAQGTMLVQ